MRKNLKIVQKCGSNRFGHFRAFKRAWQNIFIKIDNNIRDYKNYKKISKTFSKMWASQFWADLEWGWQKVFIAN